MNTTADTLHIIIEYPVIPVFYHQDPQICLSVLKACYDGGIRIFEFTNRGENAVANFKILLAFRNEHLKDLQLGIGTIKNAQQAAEYIKIGTDFLVSPIIKAEIAETADEANVFWIPGCMTPTEINLAEDLGAKLIKLFPGDTLGPGFLRAIKPLFPALKFMPTGGVDLNKENIEGWLDAGVSALGFGSKLFQNSGADNGDYSWLTERCRLLVKT